MRTTGIQLFLAVILIGPTLKLAAADPGSEVIVVYNSRMPESRALAEYYSKKRHIPSQQLFGFDLPTAENMTRSEFRDALQRPLAARLEKNKLWHISFQLPKSSNDPPGQVVWKVLESRIRCAALIYGVPLRILNDPNLKEPGAEKIRPEMQRNGASVDTELALLPQIEQKVMVTGSLRNSLYGATNLALFHPTNGVLLVTRLDGPSPEIARGLIDKALQAEQDGLWGRAYFDLRNISDPAYKTGDDMIRGSAEICRLLGYETVTDENADTFPAGFPMSHIAFYAGWYTENVSGPFAAPNVEFMPGAFAYHLHSNSANTLRSTNRQWVGPLLAKGVTITMGCIDEPYLSGTPDILVFTSRFLGNGFSFAEAAYASQPVLSWQTTIVGDPLYRPGARTPEQIAKDLETRKNKLIEWFYLRVANHGLAIGRSLADVIDLLQQPQFSADSALITEKLGDLYAAQGKPSAAAHSCEQALKLGPSSQQRLRLRLTLGQRLVDLKRETEAYEDYQKLLEENPDYADKAGIYQKLLSLAQKLGKREDAERYEAALKK